MILTITRNDGAVYLDGSVYPNLNLSFVPSNVHALQWRDTYGWIEYSEDSDGNKQQNDKITVLPDWANTAIEVWNTANTTTYSTNLAANTYYNPYNTNK